MTTQPVGPVADLIRSYRKNITAPLPAALSETQLRAAALKLGLLSPLLLEVQSEGTEVVDRVTDQVDGRVQSGFPKQAQRDLGHPHQGVQQSSHRIRTFVADQVGSDRFPRVGVLQYPHRQQLKRLALTVAVFLIGHATGTYSRRTR
jgi:hypothetical protein